VLAGIFGLFVLFLYGPIFTILVLSFQGPSGGLTFPMNGVSTHWFSRLWDGLGVVDIWAAFGRSAKLGLAVMVLTVLIALPAGYAFRRGFRGATAVFYTA
jgi:putative spermidine/putrescine transport system permease protein